MDQGATVAGIAGRLTADYGFGGRESLASYILTQLVGGFEGQEGYLFHDGWDYTIDDKSAGHWGYRFERALEDGMGARDCSGGEVSLEDMYNAIKNMEEEEEQRQGEPGLRSVSLFSPKRCGRDDATSAMTSC